MKNFFKKHFEKPLWCTDIITLLPTLVYSPEDYLEYGYRKFTFQWFGLYINFGKKVER